MKTNFTLQFLKQDKPTVNSRIYLRGLNQLGGYSAWNTPDLILNSTVKACCAYNTLSQDGGKSAVAKIIKNLLLSLMSFFNLSDFLCYLQEHFQHSQSPCGTRGKKGGRSSQKWEWSHILKQAGVSGLRIRDFHCTPGNWMVGWGQPPSLSRNPLQALNQQKFCERL